MSNEIIKKEDKTIVYKSAGEEVKLNEGIVKQFLTKGNVAVTQQEAVNFIQLCKYRKLNPFLNEAYLVKFGKDPAQLVVGFEAFKRKADENPKYQGYRAGIIVLRNKEVVELEGAFKLPTDTLIGGWCEVYVEGKKYPVVAKVSFAEYDKGMSLWKKLPSTMIRKVAISQALREAFPSEIGAMYTKEELGVDDNSTNPVNAPMQEVKTEVEEKTGQIKVDIPVVDAEVIEDKAPVQEPVTTNISDDEPDF